MTTLELTTEYGVFQMTALPYASKLKVQKYTVNYVKVVDVVMFPHGNKIDEFSTRIEEFRHSIILSFRRSIIDPFHEKNDSKKNHSIKVEKFLYVFARENCFVFSSEFNSTPNRLLKIIAMMIRIIIMSIFHEMHVINVAITLLQYLNENLIRNKS